MNCQNTGCDHPLDKHSEEGCSECFCGYYSDGTNQPPKPTSSRTKKYVPGEGNPSAQLMIVLEAPGADEDREGRPAVGPTGQFLDKLFQELGVSRSELYITNVVKVRPPGNDLEKLESIGYSIEEFLPDLDNEIATVKPNCILALGNLALETLCGKSGITKYRGSLLCSNRQRVKVIPSVHPAGILKFKGSGGLAYYYRHLLKFDIKRAIQESIDPEYMPPQRNLMICKSYYQLASFIQQNLSQGRFKVAVDIETIKSIPSCIAIAFDKHSAMCIPLIDVQDWFNRHGIGEHDLNMIYVELINLFDHPQVEVIGQNFKFDQDKIESVYGIPVRKVYGDTMFLAHTIHPELPKDLATLTSIYTREPYYKDEGREFNPKRDNIEQLYFYNAKDAIVTFECHEAMLRVAEEQDVTDFYFNQIVPLHDAYRWLEGTGLAMDMEKRKLLSRKYNKFLAKANLEFRKLTGFRPVKDADHQKRLEKFSKRSGHEYRLLNIGSPQQLEEFIYHHLTFPGKGSTDEDTLVALWGNHANTPKKKRSIELILDIRRYRKTLSTYIGAEPDYDGRMRTGYRPVGTETGRSSTSVLKPPVRPTSVGISYQNITKHGEIGPEVREMFVPDPDHVFMEADLSQAEARIVALLAEDYETLELFNTTDIHKKTASFIFDISVEEIDKESPLRFIGKTVRHAGNYDMGKRRLMITVNTDARKFGIPISLSEYKAGEILDKFHAFTPKIRSVFHEEVKRCLRDGDRILINPFGRRRQFLGHWSENLFKEAFAQVPQSSVRDQVIRALYGLKKEYPTTRICLESHDSLTALVHISMIEEYARAMDRWLSIPIDFSRCSIPRGILIIPTEIKIGEKNLRYLKDYKLPKAV